jgi:hypothetical protein
MEASIGNTLEGTINITQEKIDKVHIEHEPNIESISNVPAEIANLLGLLKKKGIQI